MVHQLEPNAKHMNTCKGIGQIQTVSERFENNTTETVELSSVREVMGVIECLGVRLAVRNNLQNVILRPHQKLGIYSETKVLMRT